jgi:hypothetical protein
MTDHVTTHFQIHVPDFASAPWHAIMTTAIDKIDTILYGLSLAVAPPWANSHNYVAGNLAQDTTTGSIYMCTQDHTSAPSPIDFATDRDEGHPFWQHIVPTT